MKAILSFLTLINTTQVPGPAEVAAWSLDDAAVCHAAGDDVSGFRYIWIHGRDEVDCIEDARVIDLAPISMALSKSANVIKAHRVNSRLLRIDLHQLGVTPEKSEKLIATWERLRDLDHYVTAAADELLVEFVEVTTATEIKIRSEVVRTAAVGERLRLSGNSTDEAWVSVDIDGRQAFISADAVRPPKPGTERRIGPQCGTAGQELAELVGSDIPIVRHDFLLRSVMHGDLVLKPIGQDGGLYYEFLQINEAADDDRTDLQEFLAAFGADFDESQALRADVGAILARSGVTGRTRVLTAFRGRGGRPGESTGVIFGTFDQQDGDDFNNDFDPLENVLGFAHRASEWIATNPNGTQAYGLFNGNRDGQNQDRQDFAPDIVAADYTVPNPHGKRIINGMCWRCHNAGENEDGLKPVGNDLAKVLQRGRDIITTNQEDADTIASRYSGDFEKVLQRSRDDHAAVVYRITRDPANQLEGLEPFDAFGRLAQIYDRYWYQLVTTETALLDLGIVLEGEDIANDEFRSALSVADVGETAAITYLASGVPINRWQWEAVYPEAILRVQENQIEVNDESDLQ